MISLLTVEIKALYPAHEVIRNYVAYYYLFNPDKYCLNEFYLAYPHINTPLFFYSKTSIRASGRHIRYTDTTDSEIQVGIIGRSLQPYHCTVDGCFSNVTIVFKPLGISQFVNVPFGTMAKRPFQRFFGWEQFSGLLQNLLGEQDDELLVSKLDQFLLSRYSPVQEPLVERAVALLTAEEASHDVGELEHLLGCNRKTLFRLFQKHLGCSPTGFKRIARFRNALEKLQDRSLTLTQAAYEAHFYDQAHFSKEVKKLTGDAPQHLLSKAAYASNSPFFIHVKKGSHVPDVQGQTCNNA
ncbi:helix-turn-helix domain-containing protein [Hymenobacter terrenus]|uniref:helix-turn-helix domain-containing protein n=1 Tax=Hymenobacter terrenus TaxID=1629124 RepID=UPI0006193D55|nr:helix-turn-helix domain-containing protein [Hymenobacter terrenus]